MRRARAAVVVLVVALVVPAASTSTAPAAAPALDGALDHALRGSGVASSRTAAIAVDLRTSETLYARNSTRSLLPASAEKLAVSFTALRVLGPRFRFHTEVVGDPTLTRKDLNRLARRFAATGIRRIAGRVFGDDTHFDTRRTGLGWKPSYLGIESPPLSALAVAGLLFSDANGSAAAAARAFTEALEQRGIAVSGRPGSGRAPTDAIPIVFDLSERLSEIVRRMDADSDNFVAEMVLKELGSTIDTRGSSAAGARVVRATLADAGVPLAGVRIADGSGLSRYDRSTVRALADILSAGVADPSIRDVFVSSLAVAGFSGTLKRRLDVRPTRGRVRAKTGTTNRASALAGVVGGRYVFAILHNGSPVPYWTARAAQDRFVTVLARS
jgi:serine-type D-Ala-D-Ala carboxypeptidase/endopeptidase (penicillin-binding protein 4)